MKRLVGTTEPVAVEHLLSVGCRPETFDQVDVVVHVALGGFDVDHIAHAVRLLIETQFVS